MTLKKQAVKKRIVLTYGTFDLIHHGHIKLLKRAKRLGDYLIVALSSDSFNTLKGKTSVYPFEERRYILKSLGVVDKVITEHSWDQKRSDVQKYKVDIFVMGDDWLGKFDDLKDLCKVVYLPRTRGVSTSGVKGKLRGGLK